MYFLAFFTFPLDKVHFEVGNYIILSTCKGSDNKFIFYEFLLSLNQSVMIVLAKKNQQIKICKQTRLILIKAPSAQPKFNDGPVSIGSDEQDISLKFYESQEYLVPIHTA